MELKKDRRVVVIANAVNQEMRFGIFKLKDLKKGDIFNICEDDHELYEIDGHHIFILIEDIFEDEYSFAAIFPDAFINRRFEKAFTKLC